MYRQIILLLCILPLTAVALKQQQHIRFFQNINSLEFDQARKIAIQETNESLKFEMLQLVDLLFYEGQIEKSHFKTKKAESSLEQDDPLRATLQALNQGYVSMFYDQVKGNAYKNFYTAYHLAKEAENQSLIKVCLLAILKYYNLEIAQNSDTYLQYLDHFERLQDNSNDRLWITMYKMIFYTKSLGKLNDEYFILAAVLDEAEETIYSESPMLAHVFYEKALKFEIENNLIQANQYYNKTIAQSKNYPFLRYHRFFANLKLMVLESRKNNFSLARYYLNGAKEETNKADTLRSNYHLNLYNAYFLHLQHKNDSAYNLLNKAYTADFKLDFRKNTLEINRLNIELETQEKENANLKLRANRTWLASALVGVVLLFLISYFAYTNQVSKNKIQEKEKEVQSMKLEKVLKDQELYGINSMIEGQEKERQRIANDLHDNLGSLVATLNLHFQTLKTQNTRIDSENNVLWQKTDELIEETYQKVRTIAHAKNAGVNAQQGLLPAVKNFASKVSITNKLIIDVEEHGMDDRLENFLELTIFRMIQELITNIIKHAHATEATIHLTQFEKKINLMVEDNGIGFDLSQIKMQGTMGLYSIQKRIEHLGGTVTIDSIIQSGTTVIIDIPLL